MFWAVDKSAGIVSIGSYGIGCFYNAIMKTTFSVYRPWIRSDKIKPLEDVMHGATGYSFPSGHSTSVSSFYSALIYIYTKDYPMDYVDGKLLVNPETMTINGFKDPGMFFGALIGWFVERRFIKFRICKSLAKKVERCFIGAILLIFHWTVIVDPVGNYFKINVVYFLLRASIPFIFMTLYPLTFSKNE